MLFNHESYSWGADVYNGPIGRWDNIRKEEGKLMAEAVIDTEDPKGKILAGKLENNFIRAASIGFRIIETSDDPAMLVKGQTRATVTKCKLVEISLVDIPANKNALALFDQDGKRVELKDEESFQVLSLGSIPQVPLHESDNMKKISLKAAWAGLLSVLKITAPEGAETVEHEFTDEQLQELNSLADKVKSLETQLADKDGIIQSLTQEKSNLSAANANLTNEVSSLKKQLSERPGGFPSGAGAPEGEKPEGKLNEEKEIVDDQAEHNQLAASLGINIKA